MEAATDANQGEHGHQKSTKSISLDTRRRGGHEAGYAGLELRPGNGRQRTGGSSAASPARSTGKVRERSVKRNKNTA